MFHEVSDNSYSIAAIFGEYTGNFNKPKIIGLDQSCPRCLAWRGRGKNNDVPVTASDRNMTFFINDPIQTLKPLPAKSTKASIIKIKRHTHMHGF